MKVHEEWQLDTRCLGRRVLVYDRLDSTNRQAALLADDPSNHGVVVLANEQTAGRGQHGRSWQCPPQAGVLLSVLLFPPEELRRPAVLTAWAAISVCQTVQQLTGVQATIKWPNDVLVHGRKICGILIEQGRGTVAGIGLNVSQTPEMLAAAGLPLATSLAAISGQPLARDPVARQLIQTLDEEYNRLCTGDLADLEARWRERLGLLGEAVLAECHDEQVYQGWLRKLTFDDLELLLSGHGTISLRPESVRHLRPW